MHHTRESRNLKIFISFLVLAILMLLAFVWALSAGAYTISPSEIFAVLAKKIGFLKEVEVAEIEETIVWKIRMPRIVLTLFAGIALSASGACYQTAFRNPLVEPYILGVSSGAAFGAALAIVYPYTFGNVQIMAFVCALCAVGLAHVLAMKNNERSPITLVLAGIIIGALFSAFVGMLKYVAPDTALRELTFWTMGGFYHASWKDVLINGLVIIPVFCIIWLFSWRLNVLSLGDEEAQSLGVSPQKMRFFILVLATLMAAVCVSSVGIIAWVGLMMPHAARFIFGQDNRYVLPASALMGALYILVCDTFARTITDAEIPIGIITSVLGAPYLLWLLRVKGNDLYDR